MYMNRMGRIGMKQNEWEYNWMDYNGMKWSEIETGLDWNGMRWFIMDWAKLK